MKKSEFREVKLQFFKGEKKALSLKFYNIWELHARIYEEGFIDAHFELSREYFEHLSYPTVSAIYEIYDFYKSAYPYLHIFDSKKRKMDC